MTKTLSYIGFSVASIFIILLFVTSKSYVQLTIAIILYPIITFLALKLFPRKVAINFSSNANPVNNNVSAVMPAQKVDIIDVDKRTFLKFIGTAGISFFIFSLLGRRAEDYLFNKNQNTGDNQQNAISTIASDGKRIPDEYRISEIDDGLISYYGFINKDGGWLIMREDTEESSFRYARGESNFAKSWADRTNLKYDYYHNLF